MLMILVPYALCYQKYDNKYITNKIKSFNDVIYANVYYSEIPKEGMYCVCLSVITINCIVKISKR